MTYPLTTLLDDDLLVSDMLRSLGIRTTDDLQEHAAEYKARRRLASLILDWVTTGDLMRIKGISRAYARLLHECDVRTVRELKYRNAENLTYEMRQANERLKLVRMTPPEQFVSRWIEQAKVLPVRVTYR